MGDVEKTYADINKVNQWVGFKPNTDLKEGIRNFVEWYKNFYR